MTDSFNYSTRVKNGAGWRHYPRVRLMISVGQPYHEGGKLRAVVDWINRNPGITEVHVSVNDLLQRHNAIAEGATPEQATAASLLAGAHWMERNEGILAAMRPLRITTRWQDWTERAEFAEAHTALLRYADRDPAFREAIEADARALAERKIKRGESVANYAVLVEHSRDYITEEVAVFALQSRDLPAAEVYPGSNLLSAEYLIGKELPAPLAPLATRYFTRIDFARINLTPQPTQGLQLAS